MAERQNPLDLEEGPPLCMLILPRTCAITQLMADPPGTGTPVRWRRATTMSNSPSTALKAIMRPSLGAHVLVGVAAAGHVRKGIEGCCTSSCWEWRRDLPEVERRGVRGPAG